MFDICWISFFCNFLRIEEWKLSCFILCKFMKGNVGFSDGNNMLLLV